MGIPSLPSWDSGSFLEGTSKFGFTGTEGWNTDSVINPSNLKLDEPMPPGGTEFTHEVVEGSEQDLKEYTDPDWEMLMYEPDCGGIGTMGSRVLPPRTSDIWYGMPPYNFLLSQGPDFTIDMSNVLGCDSQSQYISWIEGEYSNYQRNLMKRTGLADMTMGEAVQDLEALYDVNFADNTKARDIARTIWGDENIERPVAN
ncbi:hypothetical protein TWF481_005842 [Arthrobotrys musiformis]|uniref:Uncharacterized protein n=1 Tax=Arthrobotrys musiformis TaxID=47236 RepID=A0AAV9WEX5_9PEZI